MQSNPLQDILKKRKVGINCGIPSYCCANKIVIETVLDEAKKTNDYALIEATANQVNQEGGYTYMKPLDFHNYVHTIARKIGFPADHVLIGGDHLGPLPWANLPAEEAMEKASELVSMCVKAGYQKIHLDTSMRLGDDPIDRPLSKSIIARRSAQLYLACKKAFEERVEEHPHSISPVYVIGSEVPIPGGITDVNESSNVTKPNDFEDTLMAYRLEFKSMGIEDAWNHIIAVVVQPGVEFSNEEVFCYDRARAKYLCQRLRRYPDIVFEGHSTDYQPLQKLREMVEDGIAILKVGPALTFALRESLFALSHIEEIMIDDPNKRANFPAVLEKAMIEEPSHWVKYYTGSEKEKFIYRKYGLSDRCRYYLTKNDVDAAISKLINNIDEMNISDGLLRQYMPAQYVKVRDGLLQRDAKSLIKDNIGNVIRDYNFAVNSTYIKSKSFE